MTLQKREKGACCLLLLMGYDWNSNSNALFVIILLMPEASKYLIKKQLHVVCQSRALNFWYTTKLRIFDYDMLIESKTKLFAQALQYIIYALFCDSTYLQCTSLLKEAWQITKAIIAFLIISFLDFSRKGKEEGACREKKYYILCTYYLLVSYHYYKALLSFPWAQSCHTYWRGWYVFIQAQYVVICISFW